MKRRIRHGSFPLAAILSMGMSATVFATLQTAARPESSWKVQIAEAETIKRGTIGEPDVPRNAMLLKLAVSFQYLGTESDVPAPRIKVRDAAGKEWDSLSETKGGRDKECISWLSMSGFLAIGLKPPTLPRVNVESCQADPILSFYFALPHAGTSPFTLLFADAEPVVVNLAGVMMAAAAPSGAPPAIDALLQRPLSPGVVALLAVQPDADGVSAALANALRHDNPRVRAAAGRMMAAQPRGPWLSAITEALQHETDVDAAVEEAYAVLSVTSGGGFQRVLDAAERLASDNPSAFVDAVALHRQAALQDTLAAVRRFSSNVDVIRRFVSIASGANADVLQSLSLQAFDRRDTVLATAVLGAWLETGQPLPTSLVERGLASDAVEVRASTCWGVLVAALEHGQSAVPSVPREDPDTGSPEGAFGCELTRRVSGEAPREATALIQRLNDIATELVWPVGLDVRDRLRSASHLLTEAERSALSQRLMGAPDRLKPLAEVPSPRVPQRDFQVIRLLSGYPPGFVDDTMNVAGCGDGRGGELAGGVVDFGQEGRPRTVKALDMPQATCAAALRALLIAARLPALRAATARQALLLLPLTRDVWQCLSEPRRPSRDGPSPDPAGGSIQPPTKTRDVAPHYPAVAQEKRLQGAVIVKATIATTGCVTEAEVIRRVATPLDVQAVAAVSQWRYTPTLLHGVLVPVIMTVTVKFTLQ